MMDLVDESDPETNILVSKAVDSLFKILEKQRHTQGRRTEGIQIPKESHCVCEGMDMSMGAEPEVKFREDDLKCKGHDIKEGGWWIPHIPTIYAWASKHPQNLLN